MGLPINLHIKKGTVILKTLGKARLSYQMLNTFSKKSDTDCIHNTSDQLDNFGGICLYVQLLLSTVPHIGSEEVLFNNIPIDGHARVIADHTRDKKENPLKFKR